MISAGCKINLGLRITGTRPDGYHEIETLFYPLPCPADSLRLVKTDIPGLSLKCSRPDIKENLLEKAWQRFPYKPAGASVELVKRIPVGAGLGGGSSDAAAFLIWLAREGGCRSGREVLASYAEKIGADVPFFLTNCPCMASGKGEKLRQTALAASGAHLVLVWPGITISSAWAFRAFDLALESGLTKFSTPYRNSNSACLRLEELDLSNDLEIPVFERWPQLARLKQSLLDLGAGKAAMSGSGSAIYGIFHSRELARKALICLRQKWPVVYHLKLSDFGM